MQGFVSSIWLRSRHPAIARARAAVPALAGFAPRRRLKTGDAAQVFAGRLDGQEVVLKLFTGADAPQLAARQADALSARGRRLGTGPWRVPPLLFAAPAAGVLVTALVPGDRLDHLMSAADGPGRDRQLAAAAAWLLAAAEEPSAGAFQARHWARVRGEGLAAHEGPDAPLARALAAHLAAAAPAVHGMRVSRARGHGDFGPQNLIRDGDTLWGLDLGAVAPGPVLKEVARFLVTAAVLAPRPGAPPGPAAADAAALLAVPGMPPAEEAAGLLPFLVGVELAERLVRLRPGTPRAAGISTAVAAYLEGSSRPA